MLRVNNVSIRSGTVTVVDDVSIEVDARETVALVGANGAGKTTLARAIAGLRRIDRGTVTLDVGGGVERLDRLPSWAITQFGVQYVPAERPVFEALTVREHLFFPSTIRSADGPTVQQSFERALELFPVLRHKLSQLAGTLSGGEKRVLAFATAYASTLLRARAGGAAAVLVLDEPTHGLAPIAIEGVASAMASLRAHGVALVVVEQNVNFAGHNAGRGYLMLAGRIGWSGPMNEFPRDWNVSIEGERTCQRS